MNVITATAIAVVNFRTTTNAVFKNSASEARTATAVVNFRTTTNAVFKNSASEARTAIAVF